MPLLTLLQQMTPTQPDALNDWLTFVGSVVSALAWPFAVVVLALVFRVALRRLVTAFGDRVGQLTGIKLPGGIEASWPEALQHIAGELTKTEGPVEHGKPTEPSPEEHAAPPPDSTDAAEVPEGIREPSSTRPANPAEIALVSPPAAVIAAFLPVERAIREYLRVAGEPLGGSLTQSFARSSRVPTSLKRAVSELSSLRNRAAHEPDVTLSARDAIEYADAASRAVSQINRATDELLSP